MSKKNRYQGKLGILIREERTVTVHIFDPDDREVALSIDQAKALYRELPAIISRAQRVERELSEW